MDGRGRDERDLAANDLTSRTIAELSTGKLTVDMVSVGDMDFLYDLLGKGELGKYDSPVYKAYGPAAKAGVTSTPMYGTLVILLVAYIARYMPVAHRNIAAALLSVGPELE